MILKIIIVYYVFVNIVAFIMYGVDKHKAIKNKFRIPERNLIFVAALGGGLGALAAMTTFRHKIRKIKFVLLVPFFTCLHIICIFYIVKRFL